MPEVSAIKLLAPPWFQMNFLFSLGPQCHVAAGRDRGGVKTAVVDLADACSAAGPSLVRQFMNALAAMSWNAVMPASH